MTTSTTSKARDVQPSHRNVHFRPIRYEVNAEIDQLFGMTHAQRRQLGLRFRDEDGRIWYDGIEQEEFLHLLPSSPLSSPTSPKSYSDPTAGAAVNESRKSSVVSLASSMASPTATGTFDLRHRRRSSAITFRCQSVGDASNSPTFERVRPVSFHFAPTTINDSGIDSYTTVAYNGENVDQDAEHAGSVEYFTDSDLRPNHLLQDRVRFHDSYEDQHHTKGRRRKRSGSAVERGNKVEEGISLTVNRERHGDCGLTLPDEDEVGHEQSRSADSFYSRSNEHVAAHQKQPYSKDLLTDDDADTPMHGQISMPAFLPLSHHRVDKKILDEAFSSRNQRAQEEGAEHINARHTSAAPPSTAFGNEASFTVVDGLGKSLRHHVTIAPPPKAATSLNRKASALKPSPWTSAPRPRTSHAHAGGLRTGEEVYDGIDIPCASIHLQSDDETEYEPRSLRRHNEDNGEASDASDEDDERPGDPDRRKGRNQTTDPPILHHQRFFSTSLTRRPKQFLQNTLRIAS